MSDVFFCVFDADGHEITGEQFYRDEVCEFRMMDGDGGFGLDQIGELILLDSCGNYVYVPKEIGLTWKYGKDVEP